MPAQEKKKKSEESTGMHTRVHNQTHAHTCTETRSCSYKGVCGDRHGDKTTFCVLSCETPQEYCMTGSRDPGTVGVSCLCLARILFIILFCSGGKKFAPAKDQSRLIISTPGLRTGSCKLNPPAAFSSSQTSNNSSLISFNRGN